MSTELQYKKFTDFGVTTTASNLAGSNKWRHAATKQGVDMATTDRAFDLWTNSDYMQTARYAQGFAGRGQKLAQQQITPFSGGGNTHHYLKYAGLTQGNQDPFMLARQDQLKKRNLGFTENEDGSASYYKKKQVTEYQSGFAPGAGITWSTTKPRARHIPQNAYGIVSKQPKSRQRTTNERGEKVSGQMLNGAFVEQSAYDQMSENQRGMFGLTTDQARKKDKVFDAASQVVGAAHQYRQGRSRKKTGLNLAASTLAPLALSAIGGLAAGPLGAAIGSSVQTGISGGGLKDIATSGATAYLGGGGGFGGGVLGQTLAGAAGSALQGGDLGSILSGGLQSGLGQSGGLVGAAANTSGALLDGSGLTGLFGAATENGWLEGILGDQLQGDGNMSVIGDIWNSVKGAGSGALSGLGGLGDLLKGGYHALGGAKGIVGGLGDILKGSGGDIIKGAAGYYSNKEAARTQQKANDQAIGLADPNAQYKAGYAGQLNQLMANPALAMQMDPSAQFRFNLGEEAVRRKSAATGNRFSGAGRNASQEYGQGFASQEFGNQVNRLHTLSQGNTAAAQVQQGAGQNQADSKIAQYDVLAQAGSKIGGSLAQILGGNTTPPPTQASPYTFNQGTAPPQNWGQWG